VVALRFLAVLTVLAVAGAALGYLLTRDRRYLRFGLQVLKYAGLIALAVLALFALEEIAVVL
jgi:hypothetical protein